MNKENQKRYLDIIQRRILDDNLVKHVYIPYCDMDDAFKNEITDFIIEKDRNPDFSTRISSFLVTFNKIGDDSTRKLHSYLPFTYQKISSDNVFENVVFMSNFGSIKENEKFAWVEIMLSDKQGADAPCLFCSKTDDDNTIVRFKITAVEALNQT